MAHSCRLPASSAVSTPEKMSKPFEMTGRCRNVAAHERGVSALDPQLACFSKAAIVFD